MGIPGLRKFLDENELIQYKSKFPKDINIIAIDALFVIHKYLYSDNEEVLYSILNQILKFLISGIIPIYVIDGKAPIEKENILTKRRKKRIKYLSKLKKLKFELLKDPTNILLKKQILKLKKLCKKLPKSLINQFKTLLDIMNIKYIIADGEADYTCIKLCELNYVDACLSEDMDFLTLGCNNLFYFRKDKKNKNICQINLDGILKKTNLSFIQFRYLCLILGNDYTKQKINLNVNDIHNNIIKYNTIDNWIVNEDNEEIKLYLKKIVECYNVMNKMYNKIDIKQFKTNKKIIINIKALQKFFDMIVKPSSYKYHYTSKINKLINIVNFDSLLYIN